MSNDYLNLKLPSLTSNSFSSLPSQKYLQVILADSKQVAHLDRTVFEWLNKEEAEVLHQFLMKHRAAADFKPSEADTTMKLNMLEWLHLYNLLTTDNMKYKLNDQERDLLIKFIERFEHLISQKPIEQHVVKTFPKSKGENGAAYRRAELTMKTLMMGSVVLVIMNLAMDSKVIDVITLFTISISALVILYKDKLSKLYISDNDYAAMYGQMLVDNSF